MKKRKSVIMVYLMLLTVGILVFADTREVKAGGTGIYDAQEISLNQDVYGCLDEIQVNDFFMFSLPSTGMISISFAHEALDTYSEGWTSRLYDSEGHPTHEFSFKKGDVISTTCNIGLPDGKYYIAIFALSNEVNGIGYQLKINYTESDNYESELNDSFETADAINTNAPINGTLWNTCEMVARYGGFGLFYEEEWGADSDFYTFKTDSPGYVRIGFQHEKMDTYLEGWAIYLFDSERKELHNFIIYKNQTKTNSCAIGLPAGKYYVKVDEMTSEVDGIDYQLAVEFKKSTAWESEDNNFFDAADSINIGQRKKGNLKNKSDIDYYKISIPSNGYYKISFEHTKLDDKNNYWIIQTYDAEKILESEFQAAGNKVGSSNVSYYGKGAYYLLIKPNIWTDKEYSLKMNYTTPKASIMSAKSKTSGKLALKWLKLNYTDGYEILTSTNSKFTQNKKTKTVIGGNSVKKTISGLKKGKYYYVKVRGYRTVNGKKYYGAYSTTKKVKVK